MDANEINKKYRGEMSTTEKTNVEAPSTPVVISHDFFERNEESAAELKKQGLEPYGVAMRRALQSVDDDQDTPKGGWPTVYKQKLALLKAAASKPNLTEREMKNVAIALLS